MFPIYFVDRIDIEVKDKHVQITNIYHTLLPINRPYALFNFDNTDITIKLIRGTPSSDTIVRTIREFLHENGKHMFLIE